MTQHDYSIANSLFPNFRSDLNNALEAIATVNSGASAPTTTYANMFWIDTTNNVLKQRNTGDNGWNIIRNLDRDGGLVTNAGSPRGAVTPGYAGQLLRDTTNNQYYFAKGTSNTDWQLLSSERTINVKEYGAKGDGTTDDTTAIQAAIDGNPGCRIFFPKGVYVVSGSGLSISTTSAKWLCGEGVDTWLPFNTINKSEASGTHIRLVGTGTKDKTIDHISNFPLGGGKITNADIASGFNNSTYEFENFRNEDSTDENPSSLLGMSCGIHVKPDVSHFIIENMRIYPQHTSGISGYIGTNSTLGDNWDIGLWVDSANSGIVRNVQIVGYYRKAGAMITGVNGEADATFNLFDNCLFQGFKSCLIRNADIHRLTAVTSTTLEMPWTSSHVVATSGNNISIPGAGTFTWTGASKSGDKVTLSGVTPNPVTAGVTAPSAIRLLGSAGVTYGMYGTRFNNCHFGGLFHRSRKAANTTDIGFDYASAALEVSGFGIRGLEFNNCNFQTNEEVTFLLHEADDILFQNCNCEPNTDAASNNTSRFIASDNSGHAGVTYPEGNTSNLRILDCRFDPDLDLAPKYTRSAIASSRFSSSDLFKPREFVMTHADYPADPDKVIMRARKSGPIAFQGEDGTEAAYIQSSGIFENKETPYTPDFAYVTVTTYTDRSGAYKRDGNLVFFRIFMDVTGLDTTDTSAINIKSPTFGLHEAKHINAQINLHESTLFDMSAVSQPVTFRMVSNTHLIPYIGSTPMKYNGGQIQASGKVYISGHYWIE